METDDFYRSVKAVSEFLAESMGSNSGWWISLISFTKVAKLIVFRSIICGQSSAKSTKHFLSFGLHNEWHFHQFKPVNDIGSV